MTGAILIVEDEILVALEIESVLEELGYTVLGIAADLEGALAYAHHHIDLALVDLNLRDGLTGPEIGATLALSRDRLSHVALRQRHVERSLHTHTHGVGEGERVRGRRVGGTCHLSHRHAGPGHEEERGSQTENSHHSTMISPDEVPPPRTSSTSGSASRKSTATSQKT